MQVAATGFHAQNGGPQTQKRTVDERFKLEEEEGNCNLNEIRNNKNKLKKIQLALTYYYEEVTE